MPGRLLSVAGELGEVEIAGHVVRVPHRNHAVGAVTVAIRPDAIRLDAPAGAAGIAGRITRAAFVGRVVEYAIETPAGEVLAIVPATDVAFPAGQGVSLSLSLRGVALVD